MYILELSKINKAYNKKNVLQDIDLAIKEGEIHGIIGPNGAGKSTIIKIISGLLTYDSGSCSLFKMNMKRDSKLIKSKIGVVTQENSIYEDLKVKDNLIFFARIAGLKKEAIEKNVEESLRWVGLYDYKDKFPSTFSGGMKRKLNIACTLVHKPKLIILDEPTANLDPVSKSSILEIIKTINRLGTTVIYTSHNLDEMEKICTNLTILNKGEIIISGERQHVLSKINKIKDRIIMLVDNVDETSYKLLTNIKNRVIITGDINIKPIYPLEKNKSYVVEISTDNSTRLLNRLIPILEERKIVLRDLVVRKSTLEDIYINLFN